MVDGFGADEDGDDGRQLDRLWGQFVRFDDEDAPVAAAAAVPVGATAAVAARPTAPVPQPVAAESTPVAPPVVPVASPVVPVASPVVPVASPVVPVAPPVAPAAPPPAAPPVPAAPSAMWAPPEAPPTPAPPVAPAWAPAGGWYQGPPPRRRTDWRAIKIAAAVVGGAWVMVVVLAVAAVTFLGASQRTQSRTVKNFPANTGGDAAVGAAGVINPTDVSSEWTLLRRSVVPASQLRQRDPSCPTEPAAVFRATSHVVSEYSLDLTQSGMEAGHMTSSVLTYATPAEASNALAFFSTPEFQMCEQRGTAADVSGPPAGLKVQTVTAAPFDIDGVPNALALRVRLEAAGHTGDDALIFDAIHFQVGRTIAVFRYSWCSCKSVDVAAIESSNAQTVAARLEADIRTRSA